jgi:hypothetical protein
MKIVDCFIFYNELDMLKFRLEYLYDTVDHFVLVEMYKTHSGNLKPYYFNDNKDKFAKYLDKIVHVMVDTDYVPVVQPKLKFGLKKPKLKPNIQREMYHRNYIRSGLDKLVLNDNDIVIISDLDEIPDRNTLKELKNTGLDGIYSLSQDMYYYNLNCKLQEKWSHSKIIQWINVKYSTSIQLIRAGTFPYLNRPGGWHFSYFGNVDFIKNKLNNFCHAGEDEIERVTKGDILNAIKNNSDLFGSSKFISIPIEDNTYLPENYEMLKF